MDRGRPKTGVGRRDGRPTDEAVLEGGWRGDLGGPYPLVSGGGVRTGGTVGGRRG